MIQWNRFLGVIVFLWAQLCFGAVWQHDTSRTWNSSWEQRYSDWIKNEVQGDFFHSLGGSFARLRLDCADAHYALLAYFSRMHNLPFAVARGQVTNLTTRFDHLPSADARLAAFMDYLRAHYGTEALSHQDTIPPDISDIQPGDLYMWKIGSAGNYTRHTYIVKKVNSDGTFNVLYSTQANAARRGPLRLKTDFMFPHRPNHRGNDRNYWGFRRAKRPQEADIAQENIGRSNFQQYDWARSMSEVQFFNHVQDLNRTSAEVPHDTIDTLYNTLCHSVQDRVGIVNEALAHQQRLGGACMNYGDYDAHSTPGRDTGIMGQFERLYSKYEQYGNDGRWSQVDAYLQDIVEAIFDPQLPAGDQVLLYDACPIQYGPSVNHQVDLNTFREDLFGGNVSFHPNDNLLWRWGVPSGPRTGCTEYYGYPE